MRARHSLYLFTIPALLVIGLFFVHPIILTFDMSLTNFKGIGEAKEVGWRNYERIFSRDRYIREIWLTLWYTVIVVSALTVTGLFFAAMLHRLPLIRNFSRAALYTPAMMSFVVVGYVWQFLYSPLNGGINVALRDLGLGGWEQNWLGDLALAGAPILGHYEGSRAGHALTNELLRVLFATPGAVEWVTCDAAMEAELPGAGVHWGEVPQVA